MKDTDISLSRIPPHNIEAEQAVLGALLLDNRSVHGALTYLSPDGKDFYGEAHKTIFKTILDLIEKGTCDTLILSNSLRERNIFDQIGGDLYLSEILDNTVSSANIEYYAQIIQEKSMLRTLIGVSYSMAEQAYSPNGNSAAEVLEEAQRALLDVTISRKGLGIKRAKEIAAQTFSVIEQRHQSGTELIGISTGIRDLDDAISGLQNSDLIIAAGRPGMGKTALVLNIAEHAALENLPVAVFSMEMSAESLMLRLLAGMSKIDSRQLRRGLIRDSEWPNLARVANAIGAAPLFIDDSPGLSPLELKAKARRLKHEHGINLIIVDYLQLMRGSGRHTVREQEISEISRSLKALARELDIPVIACSQLNRQVENRNDKRPGLADLRESGAIEQDADVILFLYRDEIYNDSKNNLERGIAEVIIGKQRNGPAGNKVRVQFQAEIQKFRDLKEHSSVAGYCED